MAISAVVRSLAVAFPGSRPRIPGTTHLAIAYIVIAFLLLVFVACTATSSTSNAAGTWSGSLSSPGALPVGIRFNLEDQNGQLTGQTYVEDPETGEFLKDAELTGSRSGSQAKWIMSTGVSVVGAFQGDDFVGKIEFPADTDFSGLVADLSLKR